MKVQLDDRWGRPSGLWSENGELILEGVSKFSIDVVTNNYLKFISTVIKKKGNLNEPL